MASDKEKTVVNGAACDISIIPESVIAEIFFKLPFVALVQCWWVCKLWRRIISAPEFSKSFLSRESYTPVLLKDKSNIALLQGEYCAPLARLFDEQGSRLKFELINSCNGFVCIRSRDTIFVLNPMTGEYVSLPPPTDKKLHIHRLCGLGFCPRSNQYKVFRLLNHKSMACYFQSQHSDDGYSDDDSSSGFKYKEEVEESSFEGTDVDHSDESESEYDEDEDYDDDDEEYHSDNECESDCYNERDPEETSVLEVYTLGSVAWRRVENCQIVDACLDWDEYHSFTYINGSLYWIVVLNGRFEVSSFDFEKERFQLVTDSQFYSDRVMGLGILRDSPYVCRVDEGYYELDLDEEHDFVGSLDDEETLDYRSYDAIEVFLLRDSWKIREFQAKIPNPKELKLDLWCDTVITFFENGDFLLITYNEGKELLHFCSPERGYIKTIDDARGKSQDHAVVFSPTFASLADVVNGESSKILNVRTTKIIRKVEETKKRKSFRSA